MKNLINIFILALVLLTALKSYEYLAERHGAREDLRETAGRVQDDDDFDDSHRPTAMAGLRVTERIQARSGIRVQQLAAAHYQQEIKTSGRVLDLQPLLDLRARMHEIEAQQRVARIALDTAQKDFERLQALYREAANISGRELQQARLERETRAAEVQAAAAQMEDLRQQYVQAWGVELTDLFLGDADLYRDLSGRQAVLILVTASDQQLASVPAMAYLSPRADRAQAVQAHYLAPAASADPQIQGATYYYHAPAAGLRTGMNLDVWLQVETEARAGVFVPPAAIVWYGDRPWVYLVTDEENFVRTGLEDYVVTRHGWFVRSGLEPGAQLVTGGAQMLLSEEFRWSIPDEDDNP